METTMAAAETASLGDSTADATKPIVVSLTTGTNNAKDVESLFCRHVLSDVGGCRIAGGDET
jgi:hypothetical protein